MSFLKTLADAVFPGEDEQACLAATAAQNPLLMQAIMGLLGKDSQIGGLPGLVGNFQNAGLRDTVATWLASGPNTPVSAEDIQRALGGNVIDQLAAQAKMTPSEASGVLAQTLPAVVDKLSPDGAARSLEQVEIQTRLSAFLQGRV